MVALSFIHYLLVNRRMRNFGNNLFYFNGISQINCRVIFYLMTLSPSLNTWKYLTACEKIKGLKVLKNDWWIARCLTPTFHGISVISQRPSAPIHAFLEFFLPVFHTIYFPSHWLLSHTTIVEAIESAERGMNPVAMTIINPGKEYWPSRG